MVSLPFQDREWGLGYGLVRVGRRGVDVRQLGAVVVLAGRVEIGTRTRRPEGKALCAVQLVQDRIDRGREARPRLALQPEPRRRQVRRHIRRRHARCRLARHR